MIYIVSFSPRSIGFCRLPVSLVWHIFSFAWTSNFKPVLFVKLSTKNFVATSTSRNVQVEGTHKPKLIDEKRPKTWAGYQKKEKKTCSMIFVFWQFSFELTSDKVDFMMSKDCASFRRWLKYGAESTTLGWSSKRQCFPWKCKLSTLRHSWKSPAVLTFPLKMPVGICPILASYTFYERRKFWVDMFDEEMFDKIRGFLKSTVDKKKDFECFFGCITIWQFALDF